MSKITHRPHKRKPKPTHQETMLSLAMSKLARLNSGTAQLSEIMDAEKQVREWRDKCENVKSIDDTNHCHPHDCGYTVTGRICNCDCSPDDMR